MFKPYFLLVAAVFLLCIFTINIPTAYLSQSQAYKLRLFDATYVSAKGDVQTTTLSFGTGELDVDGQTAQVFIKDYIVAARVFYVFAILVAVPAVLLFVTGAATAEEGTKKNVFSHLFGLWWFLLWFSVILINQSTSETVATFWIFRFDLVALILFIMSLDEKRWLERVGVLFLCIYLVEFVSFPGENTNGVHGMWSQTYTKADGHLAMKRLPFASTNVTSSPTGDLDTVVFSKDLIISARLFYVIAVICAPVVVAQIKWSMGVGGRAAFGTMFFCLLVSTYAFIAAPYRGSYTIENSVFVNSLLGLLPASLAFFMFGKISNKEGEAADEAGSTDGGSDASTPSKAKAAAAVAIALLVVATINLGALPLDTNGVRMFDVTTLNPGGPDFNGGYETPKVERVNLDFGSGDVKVYKQSFSGLPTLGSSPYFVESYVVGARVFFVFAVLAMVPSIGMFLYRKSLPSLYFLWLFLVVLTHFLAVKAPGPSGAVYANQLAQFMYSLWLVSAFFAFYAVAETGVSDGTDHLLPKDGEANKPSAPYGSTEEASV